ncbi:hypothetical protein TRVA0_017S00430 [Trichomonascus vanleenenianus]|uniref:uncharacterized protein n=1 Tax=Trichomonascus vanleenenianus TaxID=2268995 RepID=UPI003EC9AC00
MKAPSRVAVIAGLLVALVFTLYSLREHRTRPKEVAPLGFPKEDISQRVATKSSQKVATTSNTVVATDNDSSTVVATDNDNKTVVATDNEKIFLMIKTGATEMFRKVPMHLMTTAKMFPQFAIYSDAAASVGGHAVIDALANLTLYSDSEQYGEEEPFNTYQTLRRWRSETLSTVDFAASNVSAKLSWQLDRFKNLPMLYHAYHEAAPQTVDWFLFIDADTYVSRPSLDSFIQRFDNPRTTPHYVGNPYPAYPLHFAHGGSGVLISRNALDITFGRHGNLLQELEQSTVGCCCGDIMVGFMLRQYANLTVASGYYLDNATQADEAANAKGRRIAPFQGNSFWNVEVTAENMCVPVVSFHHVSPSDIEVLWQYERSRDGSVILHRDIYVDFYRDNLPESRSSWDNSASDLEFEDWTGTSSDCATRCISDDKCLTWRYKPGYCALGYSVRLGRYDPGFESGNMRHRIAKLDSISC